MTEPATAAITEAPSATPDLYAGLRIEDLMRRSYGGGELRIHEVMASEPEFIRYLISYLSDGIEIFGFMNVPGGEGPFPVIVALHGYIDPQEYQTLDYTTRYADTLSRAGFLVVHPNLRGYAPSGDGPNSFRVGMAVDVLNLIAIIGHTGGLPGALENADAGRIGLWGHSMGGGISLRVLTVSPDVDAAVLYGSMTADERTNFEMIYTWSEGARGAEELAVPEEALTGISPLYYLHQIRAPVSVHHGEEDDLIPVSMSLELCKRLETLSVRVSCYTYPNESHTFIGFGDYLFNQRTIDFFNQQLRDGN